MRLDNNIQKPAKESLDLTDVLSLNKLLLFQEIHSFHSTQKLPISDSFQVQKKCYLDQTLKNELDECQFIISSSQSIMPESEDTTIPSSAQIRALLSTTLVPRMHARFFPKSSNRGFYSFQCYEKLYTTCWAAKARCTPTFLR